MLRRALLPLVLFCSLAAGSARAADPIMLWNANLSREVSYQPLSTAAKADDWVYVDARQLHPTQFCLGYREVSYKAKLFSQLAADKASHDPKKSTYAYLAKKDIPIIVGPDGTFYLTDGHHTLAALLASTQVDKTAYGHIVANFFGRTPAQFSGFMTDPKNNDIYLFGPAGNGLLNSPAALPMEKLPTTVYGADPAKRMANDAYRSLGWAMKETAYSTKRSEKRGEDETFENFIEFRWADLFRDKIVWNDASDDSFYLAAADADVLAHSELAKDLTDGFMARDMPGYIPAESADSDTLYMTDSTQIRGDIAPSAKGTHHLAVNCDGTIVIAGKMSNIADITINSGAHAAVRLEKGDFVPEVTVPAGNGTVIFAAKSSDAGTATVAGGRLLVNGSMEKLAVAVNAGAELRGCGKVADISGEGTISPGSSHGILMAQTLDAGAGMKLAFEFTAAAPSYDRPVNSRNDVLALGAAPFKRPLGSGNEIDVYLRADIKAGQPITGGIFAATAESFAPSIAGAKLRCFVADPAGTELWHGVHYAPLDTAKYTLSMSVTPENAGFTKPQAGYVTRFTLQAK